MGAHPRVCGESECLLRFDVSHAGSSPRMRGKLIACFVSVALMRAHPRVCGENLVTSLTLTRTLGSSPRMRGKHVDREGAA